MISKMIFVAVAAAGLLATAALADGRPPNDKEAAAVAEALKGAGFSTWRKVEFDDGKWEVDHAIAADGKGYDVDLAATDFKVIKKEIDND